MNHNLCHSAALLSLLLLCFDVQASMAAIVPGPDGSTRLSSDTVTKTKVIDEVEVVSRSDARSRIEQVQLGVEKLDIQELSKMPVLFGEKDIVKSIQLLPGVNAESGMSAGFEVRGGKASQNLVLLDEAPIYNVGHMMGLFSTFNDAALSQATLYKGMLPAHYGEASSAVLDIHGKTGSLDDYQGAASIGLLSCNLSVNGPIVKDRLSFSLAGRRSYLEPFIAMAGDDYEDAELYFYDLNAKLLWSPSASDKVTVSFFRGRDQIGLGETIDMAWGNTAVGLKWMHTFARTGLSLSSSLNHTDYNSGMTLSWTNQDYAMDAYVRHLIWRNELKWSPSERQHYEMGLETDYTWLQSAHWKINALDQEELREGWMNGAWLSAGLRPLECLDLEAGVRVSTYTAMGGSPYYEINADGDITHTYQPESGVRWRNYLHIEPRVSLRLALTPDHCLKAGYTRSSQNLHAIRGTSSSTPLDRYAMSSNLLEPEVSDQWTVGYAGSFAESAWDLTLEGYWKQTDHVYDYKDGKTFTSAIEIERLLLGGEGRSYGMEACLHKNHGRLTGWIAYTLSWSQNRIEGIAGGDWYTASNDRRHDVSVVAMYRLGHGWDAAASWVFNSGQALTAPSAKYEVAGKTYYYYSGRNEYRAPSNHHLDVSFTHTHRLGSHLTRVWTFGIYNLYNRYNPYMISVQNDSTRPSGTRMTQYSLFGMVPSVAFAIKF